MLAPSASPAWGPTDCVPECISLEIPLFDTDYIGKRGRFPDRAFGMARTRSAARFPDRTEPSMVAGNPVSVQSPARNKFFQAVDAPGRSAFCSGVASNVARRSPQLFHRRHLPLN